MEQLALDFLTHYSPSASFLLQGNAFASLSLESSFPFKQISSLSNKSHQAWWKIDLLVFVYNDGIISKSTCQLRSKEPQFKTDFLTMSVFS